MRVRAAIWMFLIVMLEETHRRRDAHEVYRHLLGLGLDVDVVVATPRDLERYADSPGLVCRDALREGTELYAA